MRWSYRDVDGRLVPLADPGATPTDAATTVVDGREVPFVIRVETGVFNRAVTTFAVLDPRPGGLAGLVPGPTPVRAWDDSGWNGRLVHRFGGGCGATFSQGDDAVDAVDPALLGAGYGVITSTLTTFQTACNDVVAAETVAVAKEHFIEAYGLPRFTIGDGTSGGGIQQLLIAQNYPGLLDAVAPAIPFPDAASIAGGVADCGLLGRWFDDPAGGGALTDAQRLSITGFATATTCAAWRATYLSNIDPSKGCAEELVNTGQVFQPITNPRGVRCTWQDSNVNLLGRDPDTGFAHRPLDNVGVQYGLDALATGDIDTETFLALNEEIGGYDIDGRWQPERMRADDDVLERTYAGGRVTAGTATAERGALSAEGAGGLVDVPVLLVNVATDRLGDIHDRQRVLAIRERLRRPDGTANPNVALWTVGGGNDLAGLVARAGGKSGLSLETVRALDTWLSAADAAVAASGDPSGGATGNPPAGDGTPSRAADWASRLTAARPADAADRCVLPDGTVVTGPDSNAPGSACDAAYPTFEDPRQRAGAPRVGTSLACALVAVDASGPAYGVAAFTRSQRARLVAVFPDGVCDWSVPGRGQVPLAGPWQSYD